MPPSPRNKVFFKGITLPETKIAPEKWASRKETSIPTIHFQGYVSFREGNWGTMMVDLLINLNKALFSGGGGALAGCP